LCQESVACRCSAMIPTSPRARRQPLDASPFRLSPVTGWNDLLRDTHLVFERRAAAAAAPARRYHVSLAGTLGNNPCYRREHISRRHSYLSRVLLVGAVSSTCVPRSAHCGSLRYRHIGRMHTGGAFPRCVKADQAQDNFRRTNLEQF
jgi:hypothetical protein